MARITKLIKQDTAIEFIFQYNPEIIAYIKDFKNRKYNDKNKSWEVPINEENYKGIWNCVNLYEFEYEERLPDILKETHNKKKYKEQLIEENLEKSKRIEPISLHDINGLNYKLREFQLAGVEYLIDNNKAFIAEDMGCIDGDAFIDINRASAHRKIKLKDIYQRFNGLSGRWDLSIPTHVTCTINNQLFLRKILGVYYKGKKKVLQITLEDGKQLKATPDHLFLKSDQTWCELQNLNIGDYILTNGIQVCKHCGTTDNLIKNQYSKYFGYCKTCMYRIFKPNKHGSTHATETLLNGGHIYIKGFLRYHPYNTTAGIYKHRLIYEANLNGYTYNDWLDILKFNKITSEHIFLTPNQIIHHIDSNPQNNSISNLQCINIHEHAIIHKDRSKIKRTIPKKLLITNIESIDNEIDVYDLTVEEAHNFVANGFIVHNCGKTIESIAIIKHTDKYPCLIICPNSIKYNWLKECNKWLKDEKNILITTDTINFSPKIFNEYHNIIMSYQTMVKYHNILLKSKIRSLIVDESHYIKHKTSQRSKLILKLSKQIDTIYLLTGTAIENKPSELIHQLQVLNKLNDLGGWKFYTERYCDAKQTNFGYDISGAINTVELNTKLRKLGYLRREKHQVLHELPEKTRITIETDISNTKEYNKARKNIYKYLMEELYKNIPLSVLDENRLQYISAEKEKLLNKLQSAQTLIQLSKLLQLSATGKKESIIEWVNDFLNNSNEKLVLFGIHIQLLKDLAKEFNCPIIIGETPEQERQNIVDDFQTNPNTRLVILNIAIGGVGFTLTAASNIAFVELDWNASKMLQAEDRCYRIGQTNKVNCFYFIGKNTIDEDIFDMISRKFLISNEVNSGISQKMETENFTSLKNCLQNIMKM